MDADGAYKMSSDKPQPLIGQIQVEHKPLTKEQEERARRIAKQLQDNDTKSVVSDIIEAVRRITISTRNQ